MVGMASIAAQPKACLPFLNCSRRSEWHWPQVSGVGTVALAASLALVWSLPWQTSQPMPAPECLLSFQSLTTLGVVLVWHSTQFSPTLCCGLGTSAAAVLAALGSRITSRARIQTDAFMPCSLQLKRKGFRSRRSL